MIGYANYVDQERQETGDDPRPCPDPVNFVKGPGNLPLLPPESKGVRGTEVAQQAKEVIRAYFLRHYRRSNLSLVMFKYIC